jgi:hypothetical protein
MPGEATSPVYGPWAYRTTQGSVAARSSKPCSTRSSPGHVSQATVKNDTAAQQPTTATPKLRRDH